MRVTRAEIHAVAQRIGAEFRPEKVILFGSHAYGTPAEDSDVDLLVVMEHSGSGVAQAIEIVRQVRSRIPVDLVVRTNRKGRQRALPHAPLSWFPLPRSDRADSTGDAPAPPMERLFLKDVVQRGEVLYESAHP